MNPVTITAWLVLLAVAGICITFFLKMRRAGAPIALVLSGTLALFSGMMTAGLGSGHLAGVFSVELRRSPVHYNFRFYALLLLGALLVVLGTRLITAAVRVARGDSAGLTGAMRATVAILVVAVPLAPIQGFATALSIFSSIALLALLAARMHTSRHDR